MPDEGTEFLELTTEDRGRLLTALNNYRIELESSGLGDDASQVYDAQSEIRDNEEELYRIEIPQEYVPWVISALNNERAGKLPTEAKPYGLIKSELNAGKYSPAGAELKECGGQ